MDDVERLKRRYERERAARKTAEQIAEDKTRQLYSTNAELRFTLGYVTAILDNMADGLSVFDTDKRVKMVNPALLADFRVEPDAVIGTPCREAFGDVLADRIDSCEATRRTERVEIGLPGKRVGMAVVSPIIADDEEQALLGFVALIRDITEAKEIDRMKTEFISNVSHELRTPLTSILGFTKIIRRKMQRTVLPVLEASDDAKVEKATKQISGNLDIIITEGERLAKLINDVLDVAKMEAGKIEWEMVPLDPMAVVDRTFAAASSLFEGRPVDLIRKVPESLPTIVGDMDRLIQVLLNLISNAAKFTDEGTVTCEASFDEKRGAVVYRVTDTGAGIATEELPLVFEKFKQVGDTLTDKPKGTGLGLPISKQIVEHHGGEIWAESELGRGSSFTFFVPVDPSAHRPPIPVARVDTEHLMERLEREVSLAPPSEPPHAKTVLVVDDDRSIRELLRQELAGASYDVVEASDGLEAIEMAKKHQPDLIILDVMMPTMNGFDAAAVLKNDPKTMSIPIVIHSIVEDRDRGFRIGIDRYLTKPTATEVLLDEVGGVLSRSSDERTILFTVDDPDTIETLDLTRLEGKVIVTGSGECIERALELNPDTIVVDASIPEHQALLQRLKRHEQLQRASFVLLADGTPTHADEEGAQPSGSST
jgi:PAS domain S-box-containing protein